MCEEVGGSSMGEYVGVLNVFCEAHRFVFVRVCVRICVCVCACKCVFVCM